MFGADWLIFIDATVLTRILWTDRCQTDGHQRTVSDHNSSLSTLCSGELKIIWQTHHSKKALKINKLSFE